MLKHHSTEDDIVRFVERLFHDVLMNKFPRKLLERFSVIGNQLRNDIHARVVDIISRLEEAMHPGHIATWYIEQSDTRYTHLQLEVSDDLMKSSNHFLSVAQRRARP